MPKKIVIMAGGTGGHVFPGLAIADVLRQHDHQVEWLGTLHGLDTKVVPQHAIPFHQISIRGLRGKGILGLLLAPFKIARAIFQSLTILRRMKPDVALGMGGYVTGPGGIACWLCRIPLVIHEQNAVPGNTNKILVHFAQQVLQAFPQSFPEKFHPITVGNPIRKSLTDLLPPLQRINLYNDKLKILVFGGSQGAQAINQCLLDVLSSEYAKQHFSVWHQTGEKNYPQMLQAYRAKSIEVNVCPFINDMHLAYEWADVVIARAGASSVSEIAAVGIGSILIPFPYAVDDHQTANARFLQAANAAIVIQEHALNSTDLLAILQDFSNNRQRLIDMANNARQQAHLNSSQQVADICIQDAK